MDTNLALHGAHCLATTRRIPAPPAAVFAAWTDPAQVTAWFGPRGMTVPECTIDLRPGGLHRTVMHDAATGTDYPNPLVIEAVEPPHRVVLRVPEDGSSCPVPGARGTLRFHPDGETGTRLEVVWEHPSAELRDRHLAMGFERGWGETLDKLTAHVLRPAEPMPGAPPPTADHGWLHRLLGDWSYETECTGAPGEAPMRLTGRERVRAFGGYWVIGEAEGRMAGTLPVRWTMTMGFDPVAGRFRGSWAGTMTPHMFIYDGALSEDGRSLILDSEGPSFSGAGTARYRDIVEMADDDTRLFSSQVLNPDGETWTRFLTGTFRRVG